MNKQEMLHVVNDHAHIADELRIVRTGDEYKVYALCSDGLVEINFNNLKIKNHGNSINF